MRAIATGFSNGGFLSHRLACDMSDVFAAIAPVSGVFGTDPSKCNPPRAVPVLHFHGTSDPIVPYGGGTPVVPIDLGKIIAFRSVPDTLQIWRTKNACLGGPVTIYAKGDATCTQWSTCKNGADVVHCRIDDGGHTWPGGVPIPLVGKTSTDISATETMYGFFTAHPMP
jgi:polyhydroxybutyrate depolymerase